MEKEFNLSEKEQMTQIFGDSVFYFKKEDIKEFIKRLKEAQINLWENYGDGKKPYDVDEFSIMLNKEIDKLVGEKLKWK